MVAICSSNDDFAFASSVSYLVWRLFISVRIADASVESSFSSKAILFS